MSQRTRKVERLVQQTVAGRLIELVPKGMAPKLTVTAVEVSPDLRQATIWIGALAEAGPSDDIEAALQEARPQLQAAVAAGLTTKYVPRLHLRLDASGAYAATIDSIMKQL